MNFPTHPVSCACTASCSRLCRAPGPRTRRFSRPSGRLVALKLPHSQKSWKYPRAMLCLHLPDVLSAFVIFLACSCPGGSLLSSLGYDVPEPHARRLGWMSGVGQSPCAAPTLCVLTLG